MPNPEIYTNRIKLLEKELHERNSLILKLESDYIEFKKNTEILEFQLKKTQERSKHEEINSKLQEKQVRLSIEEELKQKLRLRDEEIKSYLDSHLTKIILYSPEANKILDLTREISSLKIFINDLEHKLQNESSNNLLLEKAYSDLSELVYQSEHKDANIVITQYGPLVSLLEQREHEIHKIKEAFETRKEENAFLQQKIAELRKELSALKLGKPENRQKNKENELLGEIKELKEKHKRELLILKQNSQQQLQSRIAELEKEYEALSAKYKDGQFPGDFKNKNKELCMEIEYINEEKNRVLDELEQMTRKYGAAVELGNKVKEELEIYKNSAFEIGFNVETEKSGQKQGKKLALERPKNNLSYRLIRALVAAKMGEADSNKKLRKSAEIQKTLQQDYAKSEESLKKLKSQVKLLEKYLKLQKVPLPDSDFSCETESNEYNSKILLEKENEELRQLCTNS